MTGRTWLCCGAVIGFAVGTLAVHAKAQRNGSPFSDVPVQPLGEQRAAENPFSTQPTTTVQFGDPRPAFPRPGLAPQAIPPQAPAAQAAAPALDTGELCKCVGESGDVAARIKKALAGELKPSGMQYSDAPLEQAFGEISAEYNIPIQLDRAALEDVGLGPDEPVTISLHGISLKSALNHLLRQHTLTYVIQDEVLLITTPVVAEEQLMICLYDIRDLVGQPNADGPDNLIDTILSCIAPDTWADGGGTCEIRPVQPGLLAISQTQAVHEEIRALIQVIREMNKQAKPAAAALPAAPARVVTRNYVLQISTPESQEAQDALSKRLRELISAVVPDQKWTGTLADGQPVLLSVWPDRVVVRHQESVQRQVEAALVDSGMTIARQRNARGSATANPNSGNLQGGGGGGFFQSQPERE